jgi:hypothetical protein
MSELTPEVPESGLPAEAEQVAAEALAPVEQAAPEAAAAVEQAAPQAAAVEEAVVAAQPAAADVPPPPVYAAPPAAMVPVFPNGKPMLDAQGQPVSDKSRLAAALLCWFVGVLGVHRFYVGKIGTGVAMLLTCGGLGVWALIDLIVILLGSFKDQDGRALQNW